MDPSTKSGRVSDNPQSSFSHKLFASHKRPRLPDPHAGLNQLQVAPQTKLKKPKIGFVKHLIQSLRPIAAANQGKYKSQIVLNKIAETLNNETLGIPEIIVPPLLHISSKELEVLLNENTLPNKVTDFLNRFKDSPTEFIVRSSSSLEDQANQSNAGCFLSVPNVKNSSTDIIKAITEVVGSFSTKQAIKQSNLYNVMANSSNHSLFIQVMINEKAGDVDSIPVAGVGATDPNGTDKRINKLCYALGDGQGVVESRVPTETTLALLTEDAFYHRTKIIDQPHRIRPSSNSGETHLVTNEDTPLGKEPKLSNETIKALSYVLNVVSGLHDNGADIEFIVQKGKIYLLQQRALDHASKQHDYNYLSETFINQHTDNTYPIKMIYFAKQGVIEAKQDNLIIHNSLDEAFKEVYLGDNKTKEQQAKIKAVIVNQKATALSHAALMFRRENISIIEIPSNNTFAMTKQATNITIDEQRGIIILDAKKMSSDQIIKGRTGYPGADVYSMPAKHLPLSPAELKVLKHLWDAGKNYSTTINKNQHSIHQLLNQLRSLILQSDQKKQAKDLILILFYKCQTLLSDAYEDESKEHVQFILVEIINDITRLYSSIENNENKMEQLLFYSAIKSGFYANSQAHPELNYIDSLRSEFANISSLQAADEWLNKQPLLLPFEHNLESLPKSFKHTMNFLYILKDSFNRIDISQRWIDYIESLINNLPSTTKDLKTLVEISKRWTQNNTFREKFSDLALKKFNKAININSFLKYDKFEIDAYHSITQLNHQLITKQTCWASTAGFTDRCDLFKEKSEFIRNLIDSLDADHPFESAKAIKELGQVFEHIDQSLKAIVASPTYHEPIRHEHFVTLLKILMALADPLFEHVYNWENYDVLLDPSVGDADEYETNSSSSNETSNCSLSDKVNVNERLIQQPNSNDLFDFDLFETDEEQDPIISLENHLADPQDISDLDDLLQLMRENYSEDVQPRSLHSNQSDAIDTDNIINPKHTLPPKESKKLNSEYSQKVNSDSESENNNSTNTNDSTSDGKKAAYTQGLIRYRKILQDHLSVFEKQPYNSLLPSSTFNVSHELISRSVDVSNNSEPKTLGDLHTLIHQNIRLAIGRLNYRVDVRRCLPKEHLTLCKTIQKNLRHTVAEACDNVGGVLTLISAMPTEKGYCWQYSVTLLNHGIRIAFDLDNKNNSMKVAIACDGKNENERYDLAASIIEQISKPTLRIENFSTARNAWPDFETASTHTISWVETCLTDPNLYDRIDHMIDKVITTSYHFAGAGLYDYERELLQSTEDKLMSKQYFVYTAYLHREAFKLLVENVDYVGLSNFLVDLMTFPADNINVQIAPKLFVSRSKLINHFDEINVVEKLLQQELGLYEFVEDIFPECIKSLKEKQTAELDHFKVDFNFL